MDRSASELTSGSPPSSPAFRGTRSCLSVATVTPTGAELLRRGNLEWWGSRATLSVASSKGSVSSYGSRDSKDTTTEVHLLPGWWGRRPPPSTTRGPKTRPCQRGVFGPVRRSVSNRRNRYEWNGFDLDLTYVTTRVICMGVPGKGLAAAYRNPQSEVERFLYWAHGDNFRIYNLCAEEQHAMNGFPEHTVRYPFFDHSPPSLHMMLEFCHDVESWLNERNENVAVIHCKAGKGRCGTMACALLVYCGAVRSAYEALRWFAHARGGKRQGVTIPSQVRWVSMFEQWLSAGAPEPESSSPLFPVVKAEPGLPRAPKKGVAPPGAKPRRSQEAHYGLLSVRVGPVRQGLLRLSDLGVAGGYEAAVRIGVVSREAFMTKRKDLWHWFSEAVIRADDMGFLDVRLPSNGPMLAHSDGMLRVRIRRPGGGSLPGRAKTCCMEVSSWFHRSFLHRQSQGARDHLFLDLPKAYVDGLQGDMGRHAVAPPDFRLQATFEEGAAVGSPPAADHVHADDMGATTDTSSFFQNPIQHLTSMSSFASSSNKLPSTRAATPTGGAGTPACGWCGSNGSCIRCTLLRGCFHSSASRAEELHVDDFPP